MDPALYTSAAVERLAAARPLLVDVVPAPSSGTGDAWFTGPAAAPDPARLEPGYGRGDMQRDLGAFDAAVQALDAVPMLREGRY